MVKTKNIISLVTNSLVPVSDDTIILKNLDNSEISIYFDRIIMALYLIKIFLYNY